MSIAALIRGGISLPARRRKPRVQVEANVAQAAHAASTHAMAPSPAHIALHAVSKCYPGKSAAVQALSDISFSVARGEIFGIIGRSGAGKSTLLRTLNALEKATSGEVRVNGVEVGGLDEEGLVLLRRRIGMIFQHFNLLSAKTVRENIALPLRVAGVARERIDQRVDALLALVGLSDKADVYPARLSGGQKQRVGIARALVHEPDILLCDEATSALDPETTQSILTLLRQISQAMQLTVVLITHDMAVIREVCDRVLVLDGGRVVEQGEVWRVFGQPQADATRALLSPLLHGVPADLAAQLVGDLQGRPGQALVSLRVDGQDTAGGVPLPLLTQLGARARLVHGGLDRIRGHSQGELLFLLPTDELAEVQQAFADPASFATLKVIAYVPA